MCLLRGIVAVDLVQSLLWKPKFVFLQWPEARLPATHAFVTADGRLEV